ncbi:MAG: hypothetical protein RMZ42_13655 [Nostoc sp. DedQUE05]|uniref:hypothetical protein n=1 Tax=Nostoc sp. DedQUE05 TaxID=3075391 RepID=UPI002AD36654|nr:hypothetical protein [Nostoc sp. DedQUE05]MDZ8092956.1 hypothetical protein [Nostoc sp. DedQUE05]
MDCNRLDYIKSVTDKSDDKQWAYPEYPIGAYFQLNFKRRESTTVVESHARKLPKGSLIILSQVPHESKKDTAGDQKKIPDGRKKRYLTHVVELVNEGSEDEPQWEKHPWGIFRWVKVDWIADLRDCSADLRNWDSIPVDWEVMRARWGWYDTCAKSLSGDKLMEKWCTIDQLREHLKKELNLEAIK